jgi:HAD superfamily hydrolase (TIGR01549 family)
MSEATPDAVLFDIDGTLVDSTYHHALAWHRAFAGRGLTVPFWRIHRTIGMGGDRLVAEVAGDEVEAEHGDALREAWAEEYAELEGEVPALAGATELVRRLTADGYLVALASSGQRGFSERAAEKARIGDRVALLTSADDADESKPHPDILATTLDRLREDRPVRRAVVVGDTPYDVEAARRIGLPCLAVLTGGYSRAELEGAGAALVVESLTELLDLDWAAHLGTPQGSG